jgi:hypothetical protein
VLAPPDGRRTTSFSATARPLDVAVVGLRPGSGASTVASGLARALSAAGLERARVADLAPFEVGRHHPDLIVLVAPADVEPALVSIVTGIVSARLGRVVVVANRVHERSPWAGRAALCLPESRLGAALAQRGRMPPGSFGTALARLAELVAR